MLHDLRVLVDESELAPAAATYLTDRARVAINDTGTCRIAVSGGRTAWAMFSELASKELPWEKMTIYQVDERVTPHHHPEGNLGRLMQSFRSLPVQIRPMPVDADDLDTAAASYGASLPDYFDLVHLGLGTDGHTASLFAGDAALAVTDRLVWVTGTYPGHQRMTLTYPALARARQLLWLVSGREKREPLSSLLAGDSSIPAGRVAARASTVFADHLAM